MIDILIRGQQASPLIQTLGEKIDSGRRILMERVKFERKWVNLTASARKLFQYAANPSENQLFQ